MSLQSNNLCDLINLLVQLIDFYIHNIQITTLSTENGNSR